MLNSNPIEPSTAIRELDVTPTAMMANTPYAHVFQPSAIGMPRPWAIAR